MSLHGSDVRHLGVSPSSSNDIRVFIRFTLDTLGIFSKDILKVKKMD